MPQLVTSTVVATPVGEVWAPLRDFAAIGDDGGLPIRSYISKMIF
jgi:hypothetical protein